MYAAQRSLWNSLRHCAIRSVSLSLISVLPVSGGLLGLSGILASQAESVCEAYADSFALDPVVEKEEWCRITGRKN